MSVITKANPISYRSDSKKEMSVCFPGSICICPELLPLRKRLVFFFHIWSLRLASCVGVLKAKYNDSRFAQKTSRQ